MLQADDFSTFFLEVHGVEAFPWQQRLVRQLAATPDGRWPPLLDLPTGTGKTATIDIAVFHLALQAARGSARRAPVRIAFVVDRRLVVDDAFVRAQKLARALADADPASRPVCARVAHALKALAGEGPPLLARRLRGGMVREDDWARTPAQPTVLCSTVDQIGSRLLFRGYGVSDSMRPIHAGLIGADCLILLDEAHLSQPFRQTLASVARYRSQTWHETGFEAPWGLAVLTATPGQEDANEAAFRLDQDDAAHRLLQRRLQAAKPTRLRLEGGDDLRRSAFIEEIKDALDHGAQAVGAVLNRVARARDLFERLTSDGLAERAELVLLIGPSRSVQRTEVNALLDRIRTGAPRPLARPLVVVATQCIEAGVDIDLDALFTELAPLDSLRQRFGRLNRDGRDIHARAAIVATKEEIGARADDPIYGTALRATWLALDAAIDRPTSSTPTKGKRKPNAGSPALASVDFSITGFRVAMARETLATKAEAPVLMPAHVDLLSQTAPAPAPSPEVALYLHGPSRQPDSVTLVWRADMSSINQGQDVAHLLTLMPPRAGEGIELPLWVVRRWLARPAERIDALADLPSPGDQNDNRGSENARKVFRWRGQSDDSHWIRGDQVRPGDTVIVPAIYGGVDEHGWHPAAEGPATDVADAAAHGYRSRYFALRIAPGLLDEKLANALASTLDRHQTDGWETLRDALAPLLRGPECHELQEGLQLLTSARKYRGRPRVSVDLSVYGTGNDGAPRGVVFVAQRGLKLPVQQGGVEENTGSSATEDDLSGSIAGFSQSLREHSTEVETLAGAFATSAGLPPERVIDLKLAGWLHDQGKRDARFQRWMHHGDPLGADPGDEETVLAKSGRSLPPTARTTAGLPPNWRHEALSVRLALHSEKLQHSSDPELVLWLVGTHHGHGRPLFPHADPLESAPDVGPQSLAFDLNGDDWSGLFDRLRARYGAWELARMEAILRLADHRASDAAAHAKESAT